MSRSLSTAAPPFCVTRISTIPCGRTSEMVSIDSKALDVRWYVIVPVSAVTHVPTSVAGRSRSELRGALVILVGGRMVDADGANEGRPGSGLCNAAPPKCVDPHAAE